jgi:ABC-type Fe3+ transport system permease subunit
MVLVNKKILAGGLAMLIVGIALSVNISATMPAGQAGMTEEEIIDLMIAQQETQDYNTLSGILIGIGFLLVLISFGARRKKDSAKKVEKKPAE